MIRMKSKLMLYTTDLMEKESVAMICPDHEFIYEVNRNIACRLFSFDYSYKGSNVGLSVCLSATSFMEVSCCCYCIIVVTFVVVYNVRTFCFQILYFKLQ